MDFVVEETHAHFHFFTAARYALECRAGLRASRTRSASACSTPSTSRAGRRLVPTRRAVVPRGAGPPGFVRMGLSPGAADRYTSQREFQYVDVTGLAPGPYRLRGIANPSGHLLEADGTPAVTSQERMVPGVVAEPATAVTVRDARVAVAVRARRRGARGSRPPLPTCVPRATVGDCYVRVAPDGPLVFAVASAPEHGAASFDGGRLSTRRPGLHGEGPPHLHRHGRPWPDQRAGPGRRARTGAAARTPRPRARAVGGAATAAHRPGAAGRPPQARGAAPVPPGGRRRLRRPRRGADRRPSRGTPAVLGTGRGGRRTVTLRLRRPPARRTVLLRASVRDALGAGAISRRTLAPRGSR